MRTELMQPRRCFLFAALAVLLFLGPCTQAQTFSVIYSFTGGSDGGDSTAGLVNVGGNFFGTTTEGGAYGHGVVFEVSPTGQERVLYSFTGRADGATPDSGLLSIDGYLLGTTSAGGVFGAGTVFAITP